MGTLLAFLLTRGFAAAVEFTGGHDASILGGAVLGLVVTSAAALIGPLRRAMRVDPARALRE